MNNLVQDFRDFHPALEVQHNKVAELEEEWEAEENKFKDLNKI
jgi:hypothetical protein